MPSNKPLSSSSEIPFAAVHIQISGRVQGVGFRYFAEENAVHLGLTGWVRNLPEGAVEAEAEGPKEALEQWLLRLKKGPLYARVEHLNVEWTAYNRRFTNFKIRS